MKTKKQQAAGRRWSSDTEVDASAESVVTANDGDNRGPGSVGKLDGAGDAARQDDDSRIATAAYYLAEKRGFTPGAELDDWLEAERDVRS